MKRWDLCIIMIMIFTLISTLVLIPDSQVVSVWMYLCHGSPCSSELLDHSPRASEIVVNQWNEQICMNTIQYNTMWICKWNVNFEQSNNLLMAGGLFLCLNQVMLSSSLSRHQGLVLDHCKNEYRHRYTKTKSIQVPGSLHMQWARGEECSWSSWRCRSVATDRSSHPVGLSEEEERKWL